MRLKSVLSMAVAVAFPLASAATLDAEPPAALRAVGPSEVGAPRVPAVFEGELTQLPATPGWSPGAPPAETGEHHELGEPSPATRSAPPSASSSGPDPLLARQASRAPAASGGPLAGPAPGFEGIPFAGTNPPDTVGAVGPDHYVQMVNSANANTGTFGSTFAVYDKSGNLLAGPAAFEELWPDGACRTETRGDPIVLYDHLANRWLVSQLTSPFPCLFTGTCRLCVAISRTPDPIAGGWYLYDFPASTFPDYPKYAVTPGSYLAGSNSVAFFPAFEQKVGVYAFDRRRMLAGQPAAVQEFSAPFLPNAGFVQSLLPADLDGHRLPPPESPAYFLRYRDGEVSDGVTDLDRDHLELWELSVSWAHPEESVLSGPTLVEIAEFASFVGPVPQPGGAGGLAPFADPLMWRVSYRNFGDHDTLLGNFSVDADGTGHAGVRWFELRRSGGGPWSRYQEGTFAPDAAHRWMASVAMDRDGNLALGYSISSPELGIFPSIRVTGRQADDPLGTLAPLELTLVEGDAASATGLWGDYSAMTVDPRDDCTFWYTNEYVRADQVGWSTRIGSFRFPSCHPR